MAGNMGAGREMANSFESLIVYNKSGFYTL